METVDKIIHSLEGFLQVLWHNMSEFLPSILLIFVSLAIALIIEYAIRILLRMIRLENWLERTGLIKLLHQMGAKANARIIIGKWCFWITFLILIESIAHVREWTSISGRFDQFVAFIPLLIGAIIIVLVGLFISKFIRRSLNTILTRAGSRAAGLLSNITFYALMVIIVTISLSQVGFDTSLITANIAILLGALLLSFSISFVFASKGILTNILSSSYNRKNYSVGQQVVINEIEGEIIKITNISIIVKTSSKIIVIPARKFTEDVVEIIG